MILRITSRKSRAVAVGAAAITAIFVASPAFASRQGPEPMTVSKSDHPIDPQNLQLAMKSGRLLLKRINAARVMIDAGDYQAARKKLDAAEDTAGAIRAMLPFVELTSQIDQAKNRLLLGDMVQFRMAVPPIYDNLDLMAQFAPKVAMNARKSLSEALNDAEDGMPLEAAAALDATSDTITASSVYLPAVYVYDHIVTARLAINSWKSNIANIDKAIRAVDDAQNRLGSTVAMTQGRQIG